jgi:hypothetical protein
MSIFEKLAEPFPPNIVSWRAGSYTKDKSKARALAYIDARDVIHRLNDVVGPASWQSEYSHVGQMTVCRLGIKIDGEWVWKSNGAGHTDIEAEKGALSDAFKRAGVLWGIGLYLYDIDSPWVTLDEWKVIPKAELSRLMALLPGPQPKPKVQSREDYNRLSVLLRHATNVEDLGVAWKQSWPAIKQLPVDWQETLTREKDDLKAQLQQRVAA